MRRKGVINNHTLLQNEAYIEDTQTKGVGITDMMHQGFRTCG